MIKTFKRLAAVTSAMLAIPLLAFAPLAHAVTPTTMFNFTQAKLDTNWGPERIAPSGGYVSIPTYQGRSNVAEISIDSTKAYTSDTYHRTEGIKTSKGLADNFSTPGNFGTSVQVDLYLDPAWDGNAVRAGLWTVGDNGSSGTDASSYPFGIIEFANVSGHKGYRYFDDTNGYVNLPGFSGFGKWVTFKITLDVNNHQYKYSINGKEVATSMAPEPSSYLYSVILNHRNFGLDLQTNLTNNSYKVHWNGGIVSLNNKEDCKKNGWMTSAIPEFKNQGQCVSYFASNKPNNTIPANTVLNKF